MQLNFKIRSSQLNPKITASELKALGLILGILLLGHIPLMTETPAKVLRYLLLLGLMGFLCLQVIQRCALPRSSTWCYFSLLFVVAHGFFLALKGVNPSYVDWLIFLMAPFVYFLLGAYWAKNENILLIIRGLTLIMVLCSVQVVLAGVLFSFESIPLVILGNEHTVYSLPFGTVHRGGRFGSIFSEASYFAYASIIPFFYLLKRERYYLLFIMVIALFFAASLTSLLVFLFLFTLIFGKRILDRMRIPPIVASLFAILFIVLFVGAVLGATSLDAVIDKQKIWSLGTKIMGFFFMFELILDNPFGVGVVNLNAIALEYDINLSGGYLEMGIFFGLSGVVILVFFVRCLMQYLKAEQNSVSELVYLGLVGVFLGGFIHGPLFKAYWLFFFGAVESYRYTQERFPGIFGKSCRVECDERGVDNFCMPK